MLAMDEGYEVSLFAWSAEQNARDTQMTTRVTGLKKKRLFAVYGFDLLQLFLFLDWYPGLIPLHVTS